jgi:hypothetical protein
VIWKRTIVFFWLALALSIPLSIQVYRESDPCRKWQKREAQSDPRPVVSDEAQVVFTPCQINTELGFWPKTLVLSWFTLFVAFFCSFVRDVFLYLRARRRGTIGGSFRWRR